MTKVYLIIFFSAFTILNLVILSRYWGMLRYPNESEEDYNDFLDEKMSKKIRYRMFFVLFIGLFFLIYTIVDFPN